MATQGNILWTHLRRPPDSDRMNDLLKLAIEGHGGVPRWKQISRFRVVAAITGAIWALKGMPGLLDGDPAAPGLRENWDTGDHTMHHPYQPTDHMTVTPVSVRE
jgi:hypothetical protein